VRRKISCQTQGNEDEEVIVELEMKIRSVKA